MNKLIIVLTFISLLLMGCQTQRQEVLQPSDILQEHGLLDQTDSVDPSTITSSQETEEGIFILTIDNDLFYLNPSLSQYKLSDQVSYFDYDVETHSIKVQKKDQRWIVWFLDKMKPEVVPEARDVKFLGESHQIVYSDISNERLYLLTEGDPVVLFTGAIKMFDTTLNGQLIIVQDQEDTLRVIDSKGRTVYERESVIAYRIDKENQAMMVWAENQGVVLKLYEDSVTTYKIIPDLTDWLMFPTYSANFETMVQLSDLNLETGIGTMTVSSSISEARYDILNVLNYDMMANGQYILYLTDKLELYGLDVESGDTTFVGAGVGQLNIDRTLNCATYKSNDVLYLIDSSHQAQVVAEDVYQYEYNGKYVAFTNSIHDLYLESQGLTIKIDEDVQEFALGRHGVYYHCNGQIIYKPFEGPKEVIIDSYENYKSVFFANNQLYQKEADVHTITGYWMAAIEGNVVLYFLDDQGQIEVVTQLDNQWSYLKGQYELMYAGGSVLNLYVRYINGSEGYLTISIIDSKTIQIADDVQVYELVSVTEQEALAIIEKAKKVEVED